VEQVVGGGAVDSGRGSERDQLEVGGGSDMWARSVSNRKREERGAGPRVWWSARAGAGPKARKQREREKGGLLGCGLRRERWAGGLKRERCLGRSFLPFYFFFKLLFQTFKSFKLFQDFSKIQINLKTFKTPHKQEIEPCIQIMMHKHLSLLKLLK
jgi:hypothetical protein